MMICDICGRKVPWSEHTRLIKQTETRSYPLIDVCEDCYQHLITAIDELVDEEIMKERREEK